MAFLHSLAAPTARLKDGGVAADDARGIFCAAWQCSPLLRACLGSFSFNVHGSEVVTSIEVRSPRNRKRPPGDVGHGRLAS